jgi:hypothetical protein
MTQLLSPYLFFSYYYRQKVEYEKLFQKTMIRNSKKEKRISSIEIPEFVVVAPCIAA